MKIQIGLAAVALVLAWAHLRAQQDSPRVVSAPLPEMENLAAQVVAVKRVYVYPADRRRDRRADARPESLQVCRIRSCSS
ncbi:MAG TPA: hypothetical protein VEV85_18010 [Bryobacteraceae bacterium]|nr:hypothetical protein [Bryobacteraceae bacterium]